MGKSGSVVRTIWCAVAAVTLLTCVSCSQLEQVPQPEVNAHQLIGKNIRVTTIDGQVYEFQLSEVTEDELVGGLVRVAFDEIALVERRDVNFGKTVCLIGVGAAATAAMSVVLFLILFAATFDP